MYNADIFDQIWDLVGLVLQDAQDMIGVQQGVEGLIKSGDVCCDDQKELEMIILNLKKPGEQPQAVAIENSKALENPDWAKGIESKLQPIPRSRMHYVCIALVNKAFIESSIDTGGNRSLVDLCTTRNPGLPVLLATKYHNFSRFQSLNAKPVQYTVIVGGPVRL